MKALIIGTCGREHALGWKLAQSPYITGIMYVGGNGGTINEEKSLGNFKALTFRDIYELIIDNHVELVIPGSENILNSGIVDYLYDRNYTNVFGPTRNAALIETDKFFSARLMGTLNIPQAQNFICPTKEHATHAIDMCGFEGVVLKARGLTGGKGVLVCDSPGEALEQLDSFVLNYGEQILIADRLFGEEFSVFAVSDGEKVTPFPFVIRDYKRLLDNNKGPNTGGMGSHTVYFHCPAMINRVADDIMTPLIHKMKEIGYEYKGFLYAGMMLSPKGDLHVLEFNCRFGDPECQTAMTCLESDLFTITQDTLHNVKPSIRQRPGDACCVVLATKDYPNLTLKLGQRLNVPELNGAKVFHAGTSFDGTLRVAGGRVLNVVDYASNLYTARSKVYAQISKIIECNTDIFQYRSDIAI